MGRAKKKLDKGIESKIMRGAGVERRQLDKGIERVK